MEPELWEMLDRNERIDYSYAHRQATREAGMVIHGRVVCGIYRKLAEARLELKEYDYLLDLHHKRERPWIEQWQRETGHEHMLPDYGRLLEWLANKADQAERDRLKEQLGVALDALNDVCCKADANSNEWLAARMGIHKIDEIGEIDEY